MSFSLVPDMKFEKYSDIVPDFLVRENISALLIDIDNTLAPYEQPEPDFALHGWLDSLSEAGILCALISNNHKRRVALFSRTLKIPVYANCGKPKTKYLRAALASMGIEPERAAVLGDQIFTDCLAARRLGMKAFIVPPIKDKKNLFFRFKRALEKPFVKKCRVYVKSDS